MQDLQLFVEVIRCL